MHVVPPVTEALIVPFSRSHTEGHAMSLFSMPLSVLLAEMTPEQSRIMLIVNVCSFIAFVLFMLFLVRKGNYGKANSIMDKSLDWIELSNQHQHRTEQSMAKQEQQLARVIELLESIDQSLKARM